MPVNPDFEKKSLADRVRTTYPEGTSNYHELREILADENTPIINQSANNYQDPTDSSYNTANRSEKTGYKGQKTLQKKRAFGVIVYAGKNIYVDVPHRSEHPLDRPDVYASGELDLKDYQASIFYLPKSMAEETPPEGSLVSVEIPENFPNHTETNPYDAVILDIYDQIVSPSILANPTPINGADGSAVGAGAGGAGCGGGAATPDPAAPPSQMVEAANGYDKMEETFAGKNFLFTKPRDKASAPLLIFCGGMTHPWANREAMEKAAPDDLKKRIFCLWVNSKDGSGPANTKYPTTSQLKTAISGLQDKHKIKFTSYKVCGFSQGGEWLHKEIIGNGGFTFDFIGLVDPSTNATYCNSWQFTNITKMMYVHKIWLGCCKGTYDSHAAWKAKLGDSCEELTISHGEIPATFMKKHLNLMASGPSTAAIPSTKPADSKPADAKTSSGAAVAGKEGAAAGAAAGTTAATGKAAPADKGGTAATTGAAAGAAAGAAKPEGKDAKAGEPAKTAATDPKATAPDKSKPDPKGQGNAAAQAATGATAAKTEPAHDSTGDVVATVPAGVNCSSIEVGGGAASSFNFTPTAGGQKGELSKAAITPTSMPPDSTPVMSGAEGEYEDSAKYFPYPIVKTTDAVFYGAKMPLLLLNQVPTQFVAGGAKGKWMMQSGFNALIGMMTEMRRALAGLPSTVNSCVKTISVTSGFRTNSKQKKLYAQNCGGKPKCHPPTGRPGFSNHQSSLAVDFTGTNAIGSGAVWTGCRLVDAATAKPGAGPAYEWMKANAIYYGFRRTVVKESWHWEFREQWLMNPTAGLSNGTAAWNANDGKVFASAREANKPVK